MRELLYVSVGRLVYSFESSHKLIVEVNQELSDYYRSLIPKYLPVNRPRYPAHITVVRQEKETPVRLENWERHQHERVVFEYNPVVQQGKVYYWLNIFSVQLEEIRLELGLPVVSQYTLPPEGYRKCFHCTIANKKLDLEE